MSLSEDTMRKAVLASLGAVQEDSNSVFDMAASIPLELLDIVVCGLRAELVEISTIAGVTGNIDPKQLEMYDKTTQAMCETLQLVSSFCRQARKLDERQKAEITKYPMDELRQAQNLSLLATRTNKEIRHNVEMWVESNSAYVAATMLKHLLIMDCVEAVPEPGPDLRRHGFMRPESN